MDESALVEDARRGDAAAFEALVSDHRDLMFRVAYLITRSETEAEDAAQEALVKAYYALPRFNPGAPFRPWLLRIVANEAKNRRKAAARRGTLAARAGPPDHEPSPELELLAAEERAALQQALEELRAEEREVVSYRYFLELNEAETAAVLGRPRGTVKSRLSRALSRLRSNVALRTYVAVAVLLALFGALLLASPDVRSAIAGRLGIRGVAISHVPEIAPAPDMRPELGTPLTLDEAQRRAGFAPALWPSFRNPPEPVYYSDAVPGGQIAYFMKVADAEVLFTQFRGDLMGGAIAGKSVGPGTRMEGVTVNGEAGIWLEGAPHTFMIRDATGRVRPETVRLAGNVLLWESGAFVLRLEGPLSKDAALGLAGTIR